MDPYLIVKWLHIVSSTILFGFGAGTAFLERASHRRSGADRPRRQDGDQGGLDLYRHQWDRPASERNNAGPHPRLFAARTLAGCDIRSLPPGIRMLGAGGMATNKGDASCRSSADDRLPAGSRLPIRHAPLVCLGLARFPRSCGRILVDGRKAGPLVMRADEIDRLNSRVSANFADVRNRNLVL
jgi:hypothetical protein